MHWLKLVRRPKAAFTGRLSVQRIFKPENGFASKPRKQVWIFAWIPLAIIRQF
jgi:hypothetical protein